MPWSWDEACDEAEELRSRMEEDPDFGNHVRRLNLSSVCKYCMTGHLWWHVDERGQWGLYDRSDRPHVCAEDQRKAPTTPLPRPPEWARMRSGGHVEEEQ